MVTVIHKEQNVINFFFILIPLLWCVNSFSQERIEGRYCIDNKIKSISKCLILKKNKKFDIIFGEHLKTQSKLSGTWLYKNNDLTLIYEKPKFRKSTEIRISKLEEIKDSVSILFRVKDFNKGPILGLDIKFLSQNLNYITDINGKKELFFKKSVKNVYGYTDYLGYERCYFSFDLSSNQIIDITLGKAIKYNIDKISKWRNFKFNKKSFYSINEKGERIKWLKKTS